MFDPDASIIAAGPITLLAGIFLVIWFDPGPVRADGRNVFSWWFAGSGEAVCAIG